MVRTVHKDLVAVVGAGGVGRPKPCGGILL